MIRILKFKNPLYKYVFWLEWWLILTILAATVADIWVAGRLTDAQAWMSEGGSLPALAALALLSDVDMESRQPWQRLSYMIAEIMLIGWGNCAGNSGFFVLYYSVVIAKGAFLLKGKIFALVTGLALLSYGISVLLTNGAWQLPFPPRSTEQILNYMHTFEQGLMVAPGTILVAIASVAFLREQEGKTRTEQLLKEIEELSGQLERNRIARDVHDALGHTLMSLSIQLDVALTFFERDRARAESALKKAKHLASESLNDVRSAVQVIRNPDFSLNDALSALIAQLRQQASLEIEFSVELPALSREKGHELYCIIRECLTNILKHAQASRAEIQISHNQSNLELKVRDNGKGFESTKSTVGFGLTGMQERIDNLGGTLAVSSDPGQGTEIAVTVPL